MDELIELTASNAETVLVDLDGDTLLRLLVTDDDALFELLADMNEHGSIPSIPIMDHTGRWWMAYLHESGGEDLILNAESDDPTLRIENDKYEAMGTEHITFPVRVLAGPWPV